MSNYGGPPAHDHDLKLRNMLKEAGHNDPVMQAEQDRFFDANYFNPAVKTAMAKGVTTPLGQSVVYDSFIQGGFKKVVPLVEVSVGVDGVDEKEWLKKYLNS